MLCLSGFELFSLGAPVYCSKEKISFKDLMLLELGYLLVALASLWCTKKDSW